MFSSDGPQGFAVYPITNCPHVAECISEEGYDPELFLAPCVECQETVENWLCLKCGKVCCSRYQNEHMVFHNLSFSDHSVCLSFSDMSFWCYKCDNYVINKELLPIQRAFQEKKFGEEVEKNRWNDMDDEEKAQVMGAIANQGGSVKTDVGGGGASSSSSANASSSSSSADAGGPSSSPSNANADGPSSSSSANAGGPSSPSLEGKHSMWAAGASNTSTSSSSSTNIPSEELGASSNHTNGDLRTDPFFSPQPPQPDSTTPRQRMSEIASALPRQGGKFVKATLSLSDRKRRSEIASAMPRQGGKFAKAGNPRSSNSASVSPGRTSNASAGSRSLTPRQRASQRQALAMPREGGIFAKAKGRQSSSAGSVSAEAAGRVSNASTGSRSVSPEPTGSGTVAASGGRVGRPIKSEAYKKLKQNRRPLYAQHVLEGRLDAPNHPKKWLSLEKVASKIRNKEYNKVVVVVGAGISVSAGIPDFRSPKTGLYDSVKPMLRELMRGYKGGVKDFAASGGRELYFSGNLFEGAGSYGDAGSSNGLAGSSSPNVLTSPSSSSSSSHQFSNVALANSLQAAMSPNPSSSSQPFSGSPGFSPPRRDGEKPKKTYKKKKKIMDDDVDGSLLFNVDMFSKFPQLFTRFMNSSANEGFGQEGLTNTQPTITHRFLKFLQDQRVKRRGNEGGDENNENSSGAKKSSEESMLDCVVTQNIDALELKAGVEREKLLTMHGQLVCDFVFCIRCGAKQHRDVFERNLKAGETTFCGKCCWTMGKEGNEIERQNSSSSNSQGAGQNTGAAGRFSNSSSSQTHDSRNARNSNSLQHNNENITSGSRSSPSRDGSPSRSVSLGSGSPPTGSPDAFEEKKKPARRRKKPESIDKKIANLELLAEKKFQEKMDEGTTFTHLSGRSKRLARRFAHLYPTVPNNPPLARSRSVSAGGSANNLLPSGRPRLARKHSDGTYNRNLRNEKNEILREQKIAKAITQLEIASGEGNIATTTSGGSEGNIARTTSDGSQGKMGRTISDVSLGDAHNDDDVDNENVDDMDVSQDGVSADGCMNKDGINKLFHQKRNSHSLSSDYFTPNMSMSNLEIRSGGGASPPLRRSGSSVASGSSASAGSASASASASAGSVVDSGYRSIEGQLHAIAGTEKPVDGAYEPDMVGRILDKMCGVSRTDSTDNTDNNPEIPDPNTTDDNADINNFDSDDTNHRQPTDEHRRRSAPTLDEEERHLCVRADNHHTSHHGEPHGFDGVPLRAPAPMKPPIVFFGEGLPAGLLAKAFESVQTSDLVIVIGTSLKVAPMNLLPKMAPKDLLVCNLSSDVSILCPAPDQRVCHVFGRKCDDVIGELMELCIRGSEGVEGVIASEEEDDEVNAFTNANNDEMDVERLERTGSKSSEAGGSPFAEGETKKPGRGNPNWKKGMSRVTPISMKRKKKRGGRSYDNHKRQESGAKRSVERAGRSVRRDVAGRFAAGVAGSGGGSAASAGSMSPGPSGPSVGSGKRSRLRSRDNLNESSDGGRGKSPKMGE